jgi:hypothetical protein
MTSWQNSTLQATDRDTFGKWWIRIGGENPDPNHPEDGWGCSIPWTEISDDLNTVAEEIISRTPRSLADLGWQAEALWLADDELQAGGAEYHLILPLIENMRAFAR